MRGQAWPVPDEIMLESVELPKRRKVALKAVRKLFSPADLKRYLEYKFVYGNEYPYFDLVDMFPGLSRVVTAMAPRRLVVDAPVFLAGLRRSGTTLFYRLMNSHSRLFLFNERFPGDRMNGRGVASGRNLLYSDTDTARFHRLACGYLGPLLRAKYSRWGAKLALELAHPHPGSISGEAMQKILAAFPRARLILIARDPRDFVLSALDRGGRDADWWVDEYLAMIDLFEALRLRSRDSVLTIRYEDLVRDTEGTLRRCCEFSGLDYQPCMLDPARWSSKGPREYESTTIEPRLDKWRTAGGADAAVVAQVSKRCFPYAERFGYRIGMPDG